MAEKVEINSTIILQNLQSKKGKQHNGKLAVVKALVQNGRVEVFVQEQNKSIAVKPGNVKNAESWNPEEVVVWVKSIGKKYAAISSFFEEWEIDGMTLLEMEEDDLREIGITKGIFIKKLLTAIFKLRPKNWISKCAIASASSVEGMIHQQEGVPENQEEEDVGGRERPVEDSKEQPEGAEGPADTGALSEEEMAAAMKQFESNEKAAEDGKSEADQPGAANSNELKWYYINEKSKMVGPFTYAAFKTMIGTTIKPLTLVMNSNDKMYDIASNRLDAQLFVSVSQNDPHPQSHSGFQVGEKVKLWNLNARAAHFQGRIADICNIDASDPNRVRFGVKIGANRGNVGAGNLTKLGDLDLMREEQLKPFLGVEHDGHAFSAVISLPSGGEHRISGFDNPRQAAKRYDTLASALLGPSAVLNFPDKLEFQPDEVVYVRRGNLMNRCKISMRDVHNPDAYWVQDISNSELYCVMTECISRNAPQPKQNRGVLEQWKIAAIERTFLKLQRNQSAQNKLALLDAELRKLHTQCGIHIDDFREVIRSHGYCLKDCKPYGAHLKEVLKNNPQLWIPQKQAERYFYVRHCLISFRNG